MRPCLLDLFCGAGGAAMGYHQAGFDVIGVDNQPQPNYPFEFWRMDALDALRWGIGDTHDIDVEFDAIHASPPCQAYSTTHTLHDVEYPRLIKPTRELLQQTGLPYMIENVVGAPLMHVVKLCGSSFGLKVWRHRLFETNWPIGMVPPCSHREHPHPIDVTGTGSRRLGDRLDGAGGNSRKPRSLTEARQAMGIDWMTRTELSEAIPPAYTEYIGTHLLAHLKLKAGRNAMESVRDLSWGADGAAGDRRDNEQPRVDKPAQVGIGRSMSSDGAE